MKTGTIYQTWTTGTASGVIHSKREIGYVRADTYLGEPTGDYIVSTVVSGEIAVIVDYGPEGFDALLLEDDPDSRYIVCGAPTAREALKAVLGVSSFRVG